MIVTVTLNPAMDKTLVLDELRLGDTNRVRDSRTDPGGKGINVSRVIVELGGESLAMGFVAGGVGRFIEHSLNELGIFDDFIHIPGQTRTNITIVDLKQRMHTVLSESGPPVDHHHMSALYARLSKRLRVKGWMVLAGSIPPPLHPSIYADLIALAREHGVYSVLDADGAALAWGVAARPYLIKPNRMELQRLLGRETRGIDDVVGAARRLHDAGISIVIVSLGREGSIAVSDEGVYRAVPPAVEVMSAVGAGDAMVAGVVWSLQLGRRLQEALRLGTAAGAATALTPGTMLCRREDVERLLPEVVVERL